MPTGVTAASVVGNHFPWTGLEDCSLGEKNDGYCKCGHKAIVGDVTCPGREHRSPDILLSGMRSQQPFKYLCY